jgi:cyclic pyranopterin phosphate synthase
VKIEARVGVHARTGVEMEALVAVAAAGLTVYDMCKAIDRGITLEKLRLVRKSGGKSGVWARSDEPQARPARRPR